MSSLKEPCKVVMLPTKSSTCFYKLGHSLYKLNELQIVNDTSVGQHLYICSTEEIKEGDWVYNEYGKGVIHCTKIIKKEDYAFCRNYDEQGKQSGCGDLKLSNLVKIIASTDTSLHRGILSQMQANRQRVNTPVLYPTVSKAFIEAYIAAYNKSEPIVDIMIEYDEIHYCIGCNKLGGGIRHCAHPEECGNVIDEKIPKLRGNEIIITRVGINTKEEALKALADLLFDHDVRKYTCINGNTKGDGMLYSQLERNIVDLLFKAKN